MDNGGGTYSRYLDGDDSAMIELIRLYKDGLTIYLNSFTNNLHDAEDLMEDTFYKLAYKKPRYNGKTAFKTWLYTIGRNLAIDYLRKHKKERLSELEEFEGFVSDDNIEEDILKEERKCVIHRSLHKLKGDYRQVICLTYFEGFSNTEAAKIMKKSSRQITNLLYQAKKALRAELEKEGITYAGL